MKIKKNLVLLGMMGVGKTGIGKYVARRLKINRLATYFQILVLPTPIIPKKTWFWQNWNWKICGKKIKS